MCGIAGRIDLNGAAHPAAERVGELTRMMSLLAHRGPDESGFVVDDYTALGAVRLAIIDLAHGHQPVLDATSRYCLVCNGEIYNHVEIRARLEGCGHRFETRCDTEVVLRAWMEWGHRAAALFDGGFAFALYDRSERAVYLVRDRFGKRPLFYAVIGKSVVFASEMKALLACRDFVPRWDVPALAGICAAWTPVGPETPFEGVRQVPAGTILRIAAGAVITEQTFGGFPLVEPCSASPIEDAAREAASRLRESVRLRLRSDVEVGVLLSGGFDSTVIAALVHAEQPARLRSFSVTFAERQFDESAEQQRVVDAFGLNHTSLPVSGGDIASSFLEALWHAEMPQFRTAFVPMFLLARTVRQAGIKVVLSGEGADEAFLGYDIFKETRLRTEWDQLDPVARRDRLRRLYPYLAHFSEASVRPMEALFARSAAADREGRLFSHALRFDNARLAVRLLRTTADGLAPLHRAIAAEPAFDRVSAVRKAQWLEFHTLLQGYLLSSQGDRMMFAHGVEPRCPFLGPEVVSYAATLPEHYLLPVDDQEKYLLKRAFAGRIPQQVLERPKQPYRAPDIASFLCPSDGAPNRFVDWVEDLLHPRALRDVAPIDDTAALRLLEKIRQTPRDKLSPREDQAFLLLLSICALDRAFVRRQGAGTTARVPPSTREVHLGRPAGVAGTA